VPFKYAWLDELFKESATYAFFILTGYKFRPQTHSPYFSVRDLDDDDDEVEILTQTGLTENIRNVTNRTLIVTSVESYNEDEKENLISKRESSHEYD
jgi:G protein-coupled receptor 107